MPGEAAETTEKRKPRRQPMGDVDLMALGAKLMLRGARPMDLARKLSIPYPQALKLYDSLYEEVYRRVRSDDRYTPEVLAGLKDELSDTLIEEVRMCRKAVRKSFRDNAPNTRAYTHLNTAIKNLNAMHGFNAPTASVVFDGRDFCAVSPEVQVRLLQDPEARAALLMLEEKAGRVRSEVERSDAVIEVEAVVVEQGGDA